MSTYPSAADRARLYVAKLPPAIAGQGGDRATFKTASALVNGFCLSEADALLILREWNMACQPPWSETDLLQKLRSAAKAPCRKPRGWLLHDTHAPSTSPTLSPEQKRQRWWPRFEKPNQADLQAIAEARNLGLAGLELAVQRGLLHAADTRHGRCWIITDTARLAAQARRLDGSAIRLKNGASTKAWSLPGSVARHPIGIDLVPHYPFVMLVEGGPDLLAAFRFIAVEGCVDTCTAVAMLGASQRLMEPYSEPFRGKGVRLFRDADPAGVRASHSWFQALKPIVAHIDAVAFDGIRRCDGQPAKDLNDVCSVDPDDFEQHRFLWNLCPTNLCPES